MATRSSLNDFGNPESEYLAATESTAVFDVSDRTQLELSGNDRHSFFHGFCTNDIKALPVGSGCEAFLCNVKGRILGHVFVFAEEEALWIESVPGQGTALTSHLNKYHLVEDIKLTDRTESLAEFLVSGPLASEQLSNAGLKVIELSPWKCAWSSIQIGEAIIDVHVKCVDHAGPSGYFLTVSCEHADVVWQHLTESTGIMPAGADVFNTLRIEAAFPTYGIDLTDENLAQEASRTENAISFQKGCYLGQEPIARLNAMGHVNKAIKSFEFDAPELPAEDAVLLNPKNTEKEAGRVTSVAWSWSLGKPIGLGMVRSLFHTAGTVLPIKGSPDAPATIR